MLFNIIEDELTWRNLELNLDKSCLMRVGPRFKIKCDPITSSSGQKFNWVQEVRYLGVFIVAAASFRCSLDNAKRRFNRAANSIFGRVLGVASEEVLVQLIKFKCLPVLLYATEVMDLKSSTIQSLDFCVIRFAMKLFRTNNRGFVLDCLCYMNFRLPSELISIRVSRFKARVAASENIFCKLNLLLCM